MIWFPLEIFVCGRILVQTWSMRGPCRGHAEARDQAFRTGRKQSLKLCLLMKSICENMKR